MAHHVRRIRLDQLPRVVDPDTLLERHAYPTELANFGLRPLGGELYDCAHRDGAPEPAWGVRLTRGDHRARYEQLPRSVRARVKRVVVYRAGNHDLSGADPEKVANHIAQKNSRIREVPVAPKHVRSTDLVAREAENRAFAGE